MNSLDYALWLIIVGLLVMSVVVEIAGRSAERCCRIEWDLHCDQALAIGVTR